MRQYDIVFGVLLILSITDLALAAPMSVQGKRQVSVDVAHIPRDVITVFEKRGDEELEKLGEYVEKWGDPHASSSSAQLGSEHGSMNDVEPPTVNPNLVEESSDPLSTASSTYTPSSTEYGSDDESQLNSSPRPLADSVSVLEGNYRINSDDPGYEEDHVHPPDSGPSPQENTVAHGTGMDDVQPPPPQENGVAHGPQMDNVQQVTQPHQNGVQPATQPQENGVTHWTGMDDVQQTTQSYQNGVPQSPPPQENGVVHGTQLDDVQQATQPYQNGVQQPPTPQENGVAHGTQPDTGALPQENGMAFGTQANELQQLNTGAPALENGVAHGTGIDDVQRAVLDHFFNSRATFSA